MTVPLESEVLDDLVPLIAALPGPGRMAVGIGGSRAKGRTDGYSDYDFRVYADQWCGPDLTVTPEYAAFAKGMERWEARGVHIDGTWPRLIGPLDAELDEWFAGTGRPTDLDWAIWGYYLPTDLAHQRIIHDPDGVMAGWKARLATYPEALRIRVLAQNMELLRYWRNDYHYESKVLRGDVVFLAGLTSRLVHGVLQVVFALNRRWFPGDGWILPMAESLAITPPDMAARITAILSPTSLDFAAQRVAIIALINDLEPLLPLD
jgi:hypothetical protein